MASNESHAYEIMRELDVDYVLVIFGGLISYSSDGELISCLDILYMQYKNSMYYGLLVFHCAAINANFFN